MPIEQAVEMLASAPWCPIATSEPRARVQEENMYVPSATLSIGGHGFEPAPPEPVALAHCARPSFRRRSTPPDSTATGPTSFKRPPDRTCTSPPSATVRLRPCRAAVASLDTVSR